MATILSDLLTDLDVPHTQSYSDRRFNTMTFKSLFGLSKLLEEYGVESEAYALSNKVADLPRLTTPFLAHTPDGFVIVERIASDNVSLRAFDGPAEMSAAAFADKCDGNVLLVYPHVDATEPDYCRHRFIELAMEAKRWVLIAATVFIFICGFVEAGLWRHVSTILLTGISLGGLYVTYELLLKSYNIHSSRGDSICSIIDRSGCHTVLGTSAAKFFGIFGWSEVGFAYFSVTLATLLIAPQHIGYLALINACCCPFSFWSVWYQKYRAKAWCTLCLITQACLWLSLACYVFGGWFETAFPIDVNFFVIGACYVAALLLLNALSPYFDRNEKD